MGLIPPTKAGPEPGEETAVEDPERPLLSEDGLGLGGIPCRESENAFIFAWMSSARPVEPVVAAVRGAGLLAALILPSGVDDGVIDGVSEDDRM